MCTLGASMMFALCTAANAQTASSNAYDLDIHLNVPLVGNLDVEPQAMVSFTDQAEGYSDSEELLGLDTGDALLHLSTGVLRAETIWVPAGYLTVGAQASVENLELGVIGLLDASLLEISTDILSRVVIGGTCPAEDPGGIINEIPGIIEDRTFGNGFDSGNLGEIDDGNDGGGFGDNGGPGVVIPELILTVLDNPVDIPVTIDPNTEIDLGILGITLILNETDVTGDGMTSYGVSRNALHLTLNVLNLITGDVIIAHSEASISCVAP
jgi:hypothetical protein